MKIRQSIILVASTLLLILGSHATAQEVDTNYKFDQKEASVFAADEDVVHGLGMWVRWIWLLVFKKWSF